jgi:hypothetical protein
MKTMLWKELRENFKWALLAFLILIVAEFYALAAGRNDTQNELNDLTLCGSSFLLVTSFGCSAVGAALGVVQILPELRRDQWAALLHRPVPRGVIFFGKVLAGLLLYFFATLPPFLASAAYVATPGQFSSPFVPGMLVPGLSDVFLGMVSYFGAVLICLQQGRWLGSRGAIGLAIVLIFLEHTSSAFPFLLPLLVALVFLLAGWGAILSGGRLLNRPRVARISLVIIMLMGTQTALVLVFDILRFLPSKEAVSPFSGSQFEVTRDGQVLIATQRGSDSLQVVTDMSGKVVTDERYVGNDSYQNLIELPLISFDIRHASSSLANAYLETHPRVFRGYVVPIQDTYDSKERWYQLVGKNYFIGYDKLSRRCVGVCGADGFMPPGAVPRSFPQKITESEYFFWPPHLFWSGPQLYAVDFPERKLDARLNVGSDTIHGAGGLLDLDQNKPVPVVVALDKEVRVVDTQGKTLVTFPYNHASAECPVLSVGNNPTLGRYYLEYAPSFFGESLIPNPADRPTFLDELDAQGNVLHTYSRALNNITVRLPSWVDRLATFSLPLLPVIVTTSYHAVVPAAGLSFDEETSLYPRYDLKFGNVGLVIIPVLEVLLAALTLLGARRVGFSEKRARRWALFVFCFGVPGLLTFRLASDWPARVRCPHCGSKRPVEAEDCPHCHEPWTAPPSTGVEIFDLDPLSDGPVYSYKNQEG